MRGFFPGLLAWLAVGSIGVASSAAESLTLKAAADTTLFFASPGNNLGASDSMAVGGTGHLQPGRGLIRFDAAKSLPAGVTVLSARLAFSVVREPAGGGASSTFQLRPIRRSWGEGKGTGNLGRAAVAGEATWASRFHPDSAWSVPGGAAGADFGDVSASVSVAGLGRYEMTSEQLAADVRAWLADPSTEFGWVLISDAEGNAGTARRVATRENASPTAVATLTVEYTTAPPPAPPIRAWRVVDGRFQLEFAGEAGNLYEVQARDGGAATAAWTAITNVVVKLVPQTVVVTDPLPVAAGPGTRFYRVADVGDVD